LLSLGLGVPTAVLGIAHVFVASNGIAVSRHAFAIAFLGYVVAVMLYVIFNNRQVTFNTVSTSLCVYLLLGLLWSVAYSLIDLFDPAAFYCSLPGSQVSSDLQFSKAGPSGALYFSFATLTTLGYGDIVPTTPIARTLASTEAITGQLYLAVLVARLVGLHIAESLAQEMAREPRED
jgi:voltage-gated potassium channel